MSAKMGTAKLRAAGAEIIRFGTSCRLIQGEWFALDGRSQNVLLPSDKLNPLEAFNELTISS